ncbi:12018_t:CDS:2 [Entrophospora sp. SA101]|nr:12018_t:CDS:2 [Entrophospora sp. SA101]
MYEDDVAIKKDKILVEMIDEGEGENNGDYIIAEDDDIEWIKSSEYQLKNYDILTKQKIKEYKDINEKTQIANTQLELIRAEMGQII